MDTSSPELKIEVVNVFEVDSGNPAANATFVLLRVEDGRELKIFIMRDVAVSISMALKDELPDRPFTHDLTKNIMDAVGVRLERVLLNDLREETYYAVLTLSRGEETIQIDARPSDAFALALRMKASLYVTEDVLAGALQMAFKKAFK